MRVLSVAFTVLVGTVVALNARPLVTREIGHQVVDPYDNLNGVSGLAPSTNSNSSNDKSLIDEILELFVVSILCLNLPESISSSFGYSP